MKLPMALEKLRWGQAKKLRLSLLLAMTATACSSVPESPNRWTEFVKVRGHDEPIPKVWVQTEAGRLAHDIVLPASLPKPVPFDFEAARLRALASSSGKGDVATQYWQHLCNTEAGQFIFKTVEKVDGFAYMRMSPQTDESAADEDPWMYEAPGFEITEVHKANRSVAGWYLDVPFGTYLRIEMPVKKTNNWERISRRGDEPDSPPDHFASNKWLQEAIGGPTEHYAVIWRGIRRSFDRENLVAGNELIIFDRSNGERLAVLRDFASAATSGKFKYGLMWRNLGTCPIFHELFRAEKGNRFPIFAPRVLKPTAYPGLLKNNDTSVNKAVKGHAK